MRELSRVGVVAQIGGFGPHEELHRVLEGREDREGDGEHVLLVVLGQRGDGAAGHLEHGHGPAVPQDEAVPQGGQGPDVVPLHRGGLSGGSPPREGGGQRQSDHAYSSLSSAPAAPDSAAARAGGS